MFRPNNILQFESTLIGFKDLTEDVREFTFSTPSNFTFTPGQFLTILFRKDEKTFRKQYSICSLPTDSGIAKTAVKFIEGGEGTSYLWNLKKGDVVKVMAPLGVFVVKEKNIPLVFIATGTGITPFVSIISTLLAEGFSKPITLICGYRHHYLYHDLFTSLALKYNNFSYHPILSQPQTGEQRGRVQDVVSEVIADKTDAHFYLCGLYKMIKDVGQLLAQKKINRTNIYFERYD